MGFGQNVSGEFLDHLYLTYKKSPEDLDLSWQAFFAGWDWFGESTHSNKEDDLLRFYRINGHLYADLNPLDRSQPLKRDEKTLEGKKLQAIYSSSVGFEIPENAPYANWLYSQIEGDREVLSIDRKKWLHKKLHRSEAFERYLHTRFLGQKRFSLEGLESLVPLLLSIFKQSSQLGALEGVLGMAHRGRLNVLAHVLKKPYEEIFSEFEGLLDLKDVKYHQGYAIAGDFPIFLAPNPSHLEAVNPVVTGWARSRRDTLAKDKKCVLPILVHGDASFVGQGIVPETLNLARLAGYEVGGTIHVVANNQIGFTTDPTDSRSFERYCTDWCKAFGMPIFHVNAQDPEAVLWVGDLVARFRAKFSEDAMIDLIGYRKYGHNETDEPAFTQPTLYKKIDSHPSIYKSYTDQLLTEGVLSQTDVLQEEKKHKEVLDQIYDGIKKPNFSPKKGFIPFVGEPITYHNQNYDLGLLTQEVEALSHIPSGFHLHPKVEKWLKSRKSMFLEKKQVDWALGEALAYRTIAQAGLSVRLSGQDVKRGTFTHRHGVFFDTESQTAYSPFPSKVEMINSPLSEEACLGFEWGYSVACGPGRALILWEAQFGDFVNGAQVIIDQFIMAAQSKWGLRSSLVLLLPHGYEGMGPEHSSARLERFLQGAAEDNVYVASVTSPAQIYHLLRRQAFESQRPLILMSPKSLLRHPMMISPVEDLIDGYFSPVLDDPFIGDKNQVEKIILCTGKIAFDLFLTRQKKPEKEKKISIIRIEELFPFPEKLLKEKLSLYPKKATPVWVQEEPKNMGAYTHICHEFKNLEYVGRPRSASTAEGSSKAHDKEQSRILEAAFSLS